MFILLETRFLFDRTKFISANTDTLCEYKVCMPPIDGHAHLLPMITQTLTAGTTSQH